MEWKTNGNREQKWTTFSIFYFYRNYNESSYYTLHLTFWIKLHVVSKKSGELLGVNKTF